MFNIGISAGGVIGLGDDEREMLTELLEVYQYHLPKNTTKNRYYEKSI